MIEQKFAIISSSIPRADYKTRTVQFDREMMLLDVVSILYCNNVSATQTLINRGVINYDPCEIDPNSGYVRSITPAND